ncbi:MAG: diversity-generating retroelement protein Avd [Xenococcaceae cyanobacterium]
MTELPVVQKTYDLIKWYVPILNRLPRDHRFGLGNRMIERLYGLLEGLIQVRYSRQDKLAKLETLNTELDILRYQTRLLLDFKLISVKRYEYAGKQINGIGYDLGGWIKQQRGSK